MNNSQIKLNKQYPDSYALYNKDINITVLYVLQDNILNYDICKYRDTDIIRQFNKDICLSRTKWNIYVSAGYERIW